MKIYAQKHLEGIFPILSASLLLIFWTTFAVFLPMNKEYIHWVMDEDWMWVNIIGFTGSILGIFSVTVIARFYKLKSGFDVLAYGSAMIGVVLLTSLLFFETFILKGIAKTNPELVNLTTGFYQEISFIISNLLGGVLYSMGMIFLSARMFMQKTFASWKIALLIIGAPLFTITLVPGNLRILGVLLSSIALIGMGVEMLKTKSSRGNI